MSIKIEDLQLGHTYLCKRYNSLHSITILLVTGTSIKVRWNNENNPHVGWKEKKELDNYLIIEDISDFITSHNDMVSSDYVTTLVYNYSFVECDVCSGLGTIPCSETTGGIKVCPKCFGARVILHK